MNKKHSGGNRAVGHRAESVEEALTWPNVLAAIQEPKTRSMVLERFYDSSFKADSWRLQSAKSHMADCLTAAEDALEVMAGSKAAESRARVMTARRRLELELWP